MSGSTHEDAWVYLDLVDAWFDAAAQNQPRDRDTWRECFPGHETTVDMALDALEGGVRTGVGDRIDRFRLIEELGRGGQAVVYLAEDERLQRRVALKVLLAPVLDKSGPRLMRFQREASATSRLEHPGICVVHETGQMENGTSWIAMRYVEGSTLASVISGDRAAGLARSAVATWVGLMDRTRIVEQAARALHAAHEAQVIHRDVKPGNIMVTPDGDAVVLDFGLARSEDETDVTLTATGDVFGTVAYIAPERVEGVRGDRQSDVWSLGVTLFEAVTLSRPFEGLTPGEVLKHLRRDEPADPRRLNRAVSRDLAVVILAAMAKDPGHRYRTALDLAEDLQRVRERRPIRVRPPSPATRVWRWVRRRPFRAAAVVAIAVAIALGGYVVARWDDIRKGEEARISERLEAALVSGFLELGKGTPERALAAFEKARSLDRDSVEAVVGVAFAYCRKDDATAALEILDAVPESLARRTEMLRARAEVLRRAGRASDADAIEAGLPSATTALEHFVDGLRLMLDCKQQRTAQWEEARDHLHVAALMSPRGIYHFELAHAVGHLGDATLRDKVVHALSERWPDSAEASYWVGFLLRKNDPQASLRALEHCLESRPDFAAAWFLVGWLRATVQDVEGSVEAYRSALRIREEPSIHFNLAFQLDKLHDLEGAIHHMEQAVRLDPRLPQALCALGMFLRKDGRFEEGLGWLEKGNEIGGKLENWPHNFQRWQEEAEREVEALQRLDKWCADGRQEGRASLIMGRVALYCRRYEDSAEVFDSVFRTQPKRLEDIEGCYRRRAIRAAAAAGGEWPRRARQWLQDELRAVARLVSSGKWDAKAADRHLDPLRRDPAVQSLEVPIDWRL